MVNDAIVEISLWRRILVSSQYLLAWIPERIVTGSLARFSDMLVVWIVNDCFLISEFSVVCVFLFCFSLCERRYTFGSNDYTNHALHPLCNWLSSIYNKSRYDGR
jgi:hypothetical protein